MKPIDLQVSMSQAPQAGREQQLLLSNPEVAQRHGAQDLDQQHAHDNTRTKASEDTDSAENRVDDHTRDGGGQGQQQRRTRDGGTDDDSATPSTGRSDTSREIDLMA